MTKIEPERFAISLRLVCWLALDRDDRPDSLHMKVGDGLGRVPEVEALIAAIVWESGDGQVTG